MSINNIVSERGWLRLRLVLGDNAVQVFAEGEQGGYYNPQDPKQA